MTNETRLVVEALLFVVGMLGVIGVAYVRGRQTGPTAVDNLRRIIDGMARDMNERMDDYDRRQARDRQEMDKLHSELTDWKTYSRAQADYSRQLVSLLLGMGYDGEIPPAPVPPTAKQANVTAAERGGHVGDDRLLALRLGAAFNLDELRDLEFRLGVPDGALGGETIATRTRELVRFCRRRGMVDELRAAAQELRPDGGF